MNFTPLELRPAISAHAKALERWTLLNAYLTELQTYSLDVATVNIVDTSIATINATTSTDGTLAGVIKRETMSLVRKVEKHAKIVPRNYYKNFWMVLGMTAFGLPLGVALGAAIKNMGFMAIGMPIGMAIGVGVGMAYDKKAAEAGRQLSMEINY